MLGDIRLRVPPLKRASRPRTKLALHRFTEHEDNAPDFGAPCRRICTMTANERMIVLASAVSLFYVQAGFCADQPPSPKQKTPAKTGEKPDTTSKASTDDRLNALLR